MNGLWHKATVLMKMAQGGVRPFVKQVMRKLQQNVVDGLKAAGKSWDCSFGPEKFDAGPEEMEVTSISTSGVFKCKEAHEFHVTLPLHWRLFRPPPISSLPVSSTGKSFTCAHQRLAHLTRHLKICLKPASSARKAPALILLGR
jgi:hypothetical protein